LYHTLPTKKEWLSSPFCTIRKEAAGKTAGGVKMKRTPTEELVDELENLNDRLQAAQQLNDKLDTVAHFLQRIEWSDILLNYASPRRLLWTNFLAGLARGLGLTIGTALILASLGWFLGQIVTVPIIGDYVRQIIDYVESYPR
jgi:hypothetical protein